jgi:hypothetical protein
VHHCVFSGFYYINQAKRGQHGQKLTQVIYYGRSKRNFKEIFISGVLIVFHWITKGHHLRKIDAQSESKIIQELKKEAEII